MTGTDVQELLFEVAPWEGPPNLRLYQEEGLARTCERYEQGINDPLLVMATGLGKTVVFSSLPIYFPELFEHGMLVQVHRDELVTQAVEKLRMVLGPDVRIGIEKAGLRSDPKDQIVVASVQSIGRKGSCRLERMLAYRKFGIVVTDEAHHTTRGSQYDNVLTKLGLGSKRTGSDEVSLGLRRLHLGVTATPNRYDRAGLSPFFSEIVANYDIVYGIREGYLCEPVHWLCTTKTNLKGTKVTAGDFNIAALSKAINTDERNKTILASYLEKGRRPDGSLMSAMAFCADRQHAHDLAEAARDVGIKAVAVDYLTPKEERRKAVQMHESGEIDLICNMGIFTEGYDGRVECLLMARPTKSKPLFCFDEQTEVLTKDGWVSGASIQEGDVIAAFDPKTGTTAWEPVLAHVHRPLLEGEKMMSIQNPGVDLRLTNTHRVVWRGRRQSDWKVSAAEEVSRLRSGWVIPAAGHGAFPGIPLTNDEIRFISWVQTDGTYNKNTRGIAISQSLRYPEMCAEIERVLDSCGFKWRSHETSNTTKFGERKHPQRIYTVSFGAPRKEDKHLRGWGALADFLPKHDASAWGLLDQMTRDQFFHFAEAWHHGDGGKFKNATWTPRTYSLAVGSRRTADRLQSMALRRGWRCNVGDNGMGVSLVRMRDMDIRHVGGPGQADRSSLRECESASGEKVWCVSVPSGALFVRRNGKACVSGNTQMLGRGLRTIPSDLGNLETAEKRLAAIESSRKPVAVVLDFVDSGHDVVTMPSLFGAPPRFDAQGKKMLREVVDVIEEKVLENPEKEFEIRHALSLDDVEVEIRRVDVWATAKSIHEMKTSQYRWMNVDGGAWSIELPKGEGRLAQTIRVEPGIDGLYFATAITHRYRGEDGLIVPESRKEGKGGFRTLDAVVKACDDRIERERPDCLDIIRKHAGWRMSKPTPNQLGQLRRLGIDPTLATSRGVASDLISAALNAKYQ